MLHHHQQCCPYRFHHQDHRLQNLHQNCTRNVGCFHCHFHCQVLTKRQKCSSLARHDGSCVVRFKCQMSLLKIPDDLTENWAVITIVLVNKNTTVNTGEILYRMTSLEIEFPQTRNKIRRIKK